MPARIALHFTTHDGHTRRIASRIAEHLISAGQDPEITELSADRPSPVPSPSAVTVLIAPIRYGHPLPAARRFLKDNAGRLDESRLAVLLVNLTARKPGRTTAEGNLYLRKWLAKRALRPALAAAIAGRLDYPSYSWYDRLMIRLIMKITGGPTDPTAVVEYTDWLQVEQLAHEIAALAIRTGDTAAS